MTDAIQLLNFQKDFWDSFGKNTQMAYETQLQVQRYSTGIQAIHDASVQWYQEHGNNDPNGLSALWATVGKQYGIDLSTAKDVGDPMKRAKQDFDILQMQDQTRSLQQKDLISRTEALQINDKGAIYLAAQLFQDPAGVDGIKNSQWLSSSPTHKRAVALVEEVKDFQKKNATADSQAIDITKQIADLDANYNKFAAGQIPSGSGGQSQMKTALSVMGASGNYSADQMQAMQGILQGGQKSDPAAEQQRQEFLTNYAQSVQEQRNALLLKKQQLYDGLTQQRAQLEAAGIIDPKTGKPFTNVDKYKKDYEDVQRQMNTTATQSQEAYGQGAGGATPNFNSSVQPAKLNSGRGVNGAVPFAASDLSKISSGGGFGEDRGDHKHGGWDIKAPLGTSLISLVNGKVTYSGCDRDPGGFGCYIDIKDDATGNTMRYGHMQKGIYFKTGDRVGIGQNVGKVGVTGHTTGAHVHWEVIGKDGNKLNPETAFAGVNFQSRMPSQNSGKFHKPGTPNPYNQQTLNRDNTAGTTIPSNALPLPNGNYAVNNKLISNNPVINQMLNQDVKVLDQYYNHSNPIRNDLPNNSMSSTVNPSNKGNKDSHGNWLDSNYNYNSLAQRPKEERQLLHQTADRLGIPAIWLADALYIENDQFTSGNPNPYGCVGRIQFCPDSGNTKTIGGKVYSMQQIASMTASQQYELIYQYFQGSMKAGGYKLNSFADVWSTIRWNRSAAKALKTGKVNSGDGLGSTWYTDSDRVQRTVGRKYQFPGVNDRNQRANAVIHNSPVASCPTCNQLSASNSNFVHHEGLG
ncbi:MAG: M23 family metallopeptidase [Microcystaceae cyanobacterium]